MGADPVCEQKPASDFAASLRVCGSASTDSTSLGLGGGMNVLILIHSSVGSCSCSRGCHGDFPVCFIVASWEGNTDENTAMLQHVPDEN